MTARAPRPDRRTQSLSRNTIVAAAIDILDAEGESGLTFRALTARLATGAGAIYWHVADKNELLLAAADGLMAQALGRLAGSMPPAEAIRAIALAVFDTSEAHPWMGALLAQPLGPASLRIFEGIGGQLMALGVAEHAQFHVWSALINYMVGMAGQNAAKARILRGGEDRTVLLRAVAEAWARLDPVRHPFLRKVASSIPDHDDRAQYLAGIDLILAGVTTV